MFETLFTRPGIVGRYRAAPLLDERLGYLEHCALGGASLQTLCTIATHQVSLVRLLDLHESGRVSVTRVETAADRWSLPGGRRCSRPACPKARQRFIGHAERWLRFAGLLDEPARARHAHAGEVAAFEAWMRDERGLSEATVRCRLRAVDGFLDRLDRCGVALAEVGIDDIDREVARWHARDCGRITIRNYAECLRTFFRFAERLGWCAPGLADGIMPARFHPGRPLPKGLDRDEVLRLLATSEGDRPVDVRDRAILMVLVAYGLRSGEVAGLRLDDLDWTEEILRVRRPKPGRTHLYPLSRGVGQAILRYVRDGRPRRPERALFLTLNAPIRPMKPNAIGQVVRSRLDRIGITGKRRGSHALRHGTAQHLLDNGLSMKEVGDYLGHRGISATSAYARVQLGTLREVADIDLEGLA
ncbi:MAG: tyrosine-type recombinase/integrase [Gammaproteobacteria bacterium]|nr:tyrosine-type recombinase/integrase [Gammaproteobacteria bacterium]